MRAEPASLAIRRTHVSGPGPVPPPSRLPALDGVRGLALLLVFAYHVVLFTGFEAAGPVGRAVVTVARHGWLGVDLFFVLSGRLAAGDSEFSAPPAP